MRGGGWKWVRLRPGRLVPSCLAWFWPKQIQKMQKMLTSSVGGSCRGCRVAAMIIVSFQFCLEVMWKSGGYIFTNQEGLKMKAKSKKNWGALNSWKNILLLAILLHSTWCSRHVKPCSAPPPQSCSCLQRHCPRGVPCSQQLHCQRLTPHVCTKLYVHLFIPEAPLVSLRVLVFSVCAPVYQGSWIIETKVLSKLADNSCPVDRSLAPAASIAGLKQEEQLQLRKNLLATFLIEDCLRKRRSVHDLCHQVIRTSFPT